MDAIEAVAEEVAENLEEAAAATRRIDTKSVGVLLVGLGIGLGVGFYFGYRWNREKIKAEAYKESEEEISKYREIYQQKTVAAQEKPSIEEVIEKRGYSVVEEEHERPLRPPVPITIVTPPSAIGPSIVDGTELSWDYPTELAGRSQDAPYVIHQDEYKNSETGYDQVTFTYYAGDDVLTGEDEKPLPHADLIVGQNNLKWGHGADDIDVVFVRNDERELEMEICRIPASYEEEVLGLHNDEDN